MTECESNPNVPSHFLCNVNISSIKKFFSLCNHDIDKSPVSNFYNDNLQQKRDSQWLEKKTGCSYYSFYMKFLKIKKIYSCQMFSKSKN